MRRFRGALTKSALAEPATRTPDATVARERAVVVDLGLVAPGSPVAALLIAFPLFDGETIVLERERLEVRGPGNYTWYGSIPGSPLSTAIITVVDGAVAGSLSLIDGKDLSLRRFLIRRDVDGGHVLRRLEMSAFPLEARPTPQRIGTKPGLPLEKDAAADPLVQTDASTTIDIMIVFTNQVAARIGTAVPAEAQAAVDEANTIYANSGINTRLRLVYTGRVYYDESGDFATDLSRLQNPSDGYLDEVQALRNTYSADLVEMFIEATAYCGIGYVYPSESYAFTVSNRGCAAGNWTLAHEVGHNFGALHEPYQDPSVWPFAYGHGHVKLTAPGWRTVMSYGSQCSSVGVSCPRIPFFSNPLLTYNGTSLGTVENGTTPTSDNVRVHNGRANAIANFRQSLVTCTPTLTPAAATISGAGGSGSIAVSNTATCAWTATPSASWITITSGGNGSGGGTVGYAVAANAGVARSGDDHHRDAGLHHQPGCRLRVRGDHAGVGARRRQHAQRSGECGQRLRVDSERIDVVDHLGGAGTGTGSGSFSYQVARTPAPPAPDRLPWAGARSPSTRRVSPG